MFDLIVGAVVLVVFYKVVKFAKAQQEKAEDKRLRQEQRQRSLDKIEALKERQAQYAVKREKREQTEEEMTNRASTAIAKETRTLEDLKHIVDLYELVKAKRESEENSGILFMIWPYVEEYNALSGDEPITKSDKQKIVERLVWWMKTHGHKPHMAFRFKYKMAELKQYVEGDFIEMTPELKNVRDIQFNRSVAWHSRKERYF